MDDRGQYPKQAWGRPSLACPAPHPSIKVCDHEVCKNAACSSLDSNAHFAFARPMLSTRRDYPNIALILSYAICLWSPGGLVDVWVGLLKVSRSAIKLYGVPQTRRCRWLILVLGILFTYQH